MKRDGRFGREAVFYVHPTREIVSEKCVIPENN
jgi:hypothetical protein